MTELSGFGAWFLIVAALAWSLLALVWLIIPGHNLMALGAFCGAVGCSITLVVALTTRGDEQ